MPTQTSRPIDATTLTLCHRLDTTLERVIRARVDQIIDELHTAMRGQSGPAALRREIRQAERAQRRLFLALTRQLLRDIEATLRVKVREEVRRERKARAVPGAKDSAPAGTRERRPRRRPVRPPPPPLDPEQIKRDAETQRLRALLRPTGEQPVAPPPPPVVAAPSPPPAAPSTPGGFLRALEREIQDAVPSLSRLSPERCGAQIAAWAGLVRELRDRLPAETSASMRPAFRIFLEHLVELRAAMDARFVDALDPKWHPPSWADYVEVNLARAQGRAPALGADRLQAHHRAMLRALVMPHRKNVREQALPVIAAAAEVLPEDDGLLRSARRRHSERVPAKQERLATEPAELAADPPLLDRTSETSGVGGAGESDAPAPSENDDAAPEAFTEGEPENAGALPSELLPDPPAPSTADEPMEGQSEFERPWTK